MTQEENIEMKSAEWTALPDHKMVNDKVLSPWENAGVNDNLIHDFLKRRLLKETGSMILFQIFLVLVCGLAIITDLMIYNDIYLLILASVTAMITLFFLYGNLYERRLILKIIREKDYVLCDGIAYEEAGSRQEKLCHFKDKNGIVFLEKQNGIPPAPAAIPYYHYFSGKDLSGKLLRVKNGSKGFLYIFFPVSYLEKDE